MHCVPELYNTIDYMCTVDEESVEVCLEECTFLEYPCEEDVYELACMYMQENTWRNPNDAYEAADLYILIRNAFNSEIY